ncbi:glycosyltransferase family 39 protein [Leptolyngbya sp. FACHB-17]|uniref:ArnT family glycosyltransferase n=1 Tax=unclassified Leptolyngbya TaxID=2650499 RepID=UPI00167FF9B9|nr:glycosyltransferase family 39 protein [Leptolyngbya sp. FACHB-17]MBD2080106.1 glycosyltransferase family 39 protein [Leptolyngbya sp. FACHB-17]
MDDQIEMPGKTRSLLLERCFVIVWVLALGGIAFFNQLGSIGLVDETEPLFVESARQMTVTGNWITPYFNQVTRFDKPPLIYWLMAIAFKTVGVNEWAARLPSAISGTVLVGFCFYTIRRFVPLRIAPYLGSAIVAFNLITLFFGRLGYSDMLLSACFGGSLLAFFFGYVRSDQRWYRAFYGLMGLAVLTKGPVGVVLPSAIVLIFLFWARNLRGVLREMKPIQGTGIFLLVSVPWYLLAYLQNGNAFIQSFFGLHNVERFTNVVNQHSGAWYYHLVIVLVGFFPWSLCLPAAIAHAIRQPKWQQEPRSQHLGKFALVWFAVVLIFFTIAVTKYITYTLPLYPAAAILVTLWFVHHFSQSRQSIPVKATVYFSIAISVAVGVLIFYSPNWLNRDPAMPNLGLRMQQSGLHHIGASIWITAAIVGLVLAIQYRLRWYWAVNLVAFAAFILFFITPAVSIIDSVRQLPLRQIAQATIEDRRPNEPIIMATDAFEKPSLVFYTQQPITFLNRARMIQPYLQKLRKEGKTTSIVMITTPTALQEGNVKPNQYQPLQQYRQYQLVRVPIRSSK